MRVPLLKEIILKDFSYDSILKKINPDDFQQAPYLIIFEGQSLEDEKKIIDILYKVLKNLGISLFCPYPIFVQAKYLTNHRHLNIIKSTSEIPDHFKLHDRVLTKKDLLLLRKVFILQEKCKQIDSEEHQHTLKESLKNNRRIYENAHEMHFLEGLLKQQEQDRRTIDQLKKLGP